MLDKLKQVEDRYEELCARAEQPDFYADPKKAAAWLREQKELAPIVAAYRAYCAAQRDMQDAAELMAGQALSFEQISKACIPYIVMLMIALLLITYVEPISMGLIWLTGASAI